MFRKWVLRQAVRILSGVANNTILRDRCLKRLNVVIDLPKLTEEQELNVLCAIWDSSAKIVEILIKAMEDWNGGKI